MCILHDIRYHTPILEYKGHTGGMDDVSRASNEDHGVSGVVWVGHQMKKKK